MIDITALTAAQVLSIPLTEPERLFSGDADKAKGEYRKLSMHWHPDRNGDADASKVCSHVNTLYDEATRKLAAGTWQVPGLFTFKATSGKEYGLRYKSRRPFELGTMYVAEKLACYVIDRENEDLYREAKRRLTSFKFYDKKMEAEVRRYLPKITEEQVTADSFVMLVEKTPDVFCLADVLAASDGKLDPKHVAWIISSLMNIACYFKYAGIVHNDISTETVFVSPEHHSVMLLGGWWYSRPVGQKLMALSARTVNDCDPALLKKPLAEHALDLELVKLTAREALGHASSSVLLRSKAAPPAMLTWLQTVGTDKVFEEYKLWQEKVLKEAFGPRKFVELKLTADDVYKPGSIVDTWA